LVLNLQGGVFLKTNCFFAAWIIFSADGTSSFVVWTTVWLKLMVVLPSRQPLIDQFPEGSSAVSLVNVFVAIFLGDQVLGKTSAGGVLLGSYSNLFRQLFCQ
jgi:hypothetical protein